MFDRIYIYVWRHLFNEQPLFSAKSKHSNSLGQGLQSGAKGLQSGAGIKKWGKGIQSGAGITKWCSSTLCNSFMTLSNISISHAFFT